MALRDVRPGLRTIHNGSNGVAKAAVSVPVGGELTVPDEVAVQLMKQASGAFKDGPAPEVVEAVEVVEVVADDAPAVEPAKAGRRKPSK